VFACECSAIHLTASCSVMKPLITSVSPSGHRISTPQPNPGFFRATKVGRCSDIRRICACADTVQASYPATIRNSPCTTLGRPPVSPGFTGSRTPVDRRQRVWSPALAFVNWDAGGRCYSKLPVPRSPDCHAGNGPGSLTPGAVLFGASRAAPARFRFMRLTPISRASIRVFGFCNFW
jgi:hypothetical protein